MRRGFANFVSAKWVSIEALCAMHPRTVNVFLDSADMLKRGDTDPWLGNLTVARFPSSFASGDGLTRSRLMGIGGHVLLARTRSSALTPHLSEEPRKESRIGSDFFFVPSGSQP
jgi:hypothetical protein